MPEAPPAWSLKRRVSAISGLAVIAAVVVGGLAMYWAVGVEDEHSRDARLQYLAAAICALVERGLTEVDKVEPTGDWRIESRRTTAPAYRYQVWSRGGGLILQSHRADGTRPIAELSRVGFQTVRYAGKEFRTYSIPTVDGSATILVAESVDEWAKEVGLDAALFMAFLLIPFGILFGANWWLLRRSFRSVDALAHQLRQRDPLDLRSVTIEAPPNEMLPILRSLESHFERIKRTISAERRFTSVVAHEMRTPLAGIRAQAQLANTARTPEEMRGSLQLLMRGIDRSSRILEQLLDLAQIESLREEGQAGVKWINVRSAYEDVMHDLAPKAQAKRVTVGTRFRTELVQVAGSGMPFFLMLRNLLVNAVLYVPEEGRVEVRTRRHGDDVVLTVDDSGPGIDARDRERAFERFNRLGHTGNEGAGLGLSIVLQAVELQGARIQLLESPLGGLRVEVRFPRRGASPSGSNSGSCLAMPSDRSRANDLAPR